MIPFDYSKITNPVLSRSDKHFRDPAVLVHDGRIYVFFTWYDPEKITWHIGMNSTEDFIHFSDVCLISPEGYASPGNVIWSQGRWVLCYQQYRQYPHYLCLSYSEDLLHWSEPVRIFNTGSENQWNIDKRVIDPFLVEWQGKYYCYYTGSTRGSVQPGYNLIGVAGSDDLTNWRDLSVEKPVIGVDFPWEEPDGCENNYVIRYQDRWHMLYSASLIHQKIAYAVSDDLLHWEKKGLCEVPVFAESAFHFGAPCIIEGLPDREHFYMIYQGRSETGQMSFILLESDDLVNWH